MRFTILMVEKVLESEEMQVLLQKVSQGKNIIGSVADHIVDLKNSEAETE